MMTKQPDTAVWICSLQHSGALPSTLQYCPERCFRSSLLSPPPLTVCVLLYTVFTINFSWLSAFYRTLYCPEPSLFFLFFFFLNYESQQLVTCL